VDAKKKELVGEFKNSGSQWRPSGEPVHVLTHDFPDKELGKAVPYGIYDVAANTGWVNVGTDHDTAAFAVESIRRWWNAVGRTAYPQARRLLISADAGGSNGYRTRAWKAELARLSAETNLTVTVCHLPPGTSKWNKIEHRLFSHITMNWRGRPLTSHEVIVQSIAATTTRTGLRVDAQLDTGLYPTGVKVSNADMGALPISRHRFHGDWNYTLHPTADAAASAQTAVHQDAGPAGTMSQLTGLSATELDELIASLTELRQAHWQARVDNCPTEEHLPRPGRPLRFPFPDRVVATLLHLRLDLNTRDLAQLYAISLATVRRVLRETRPLLEEHGHIVTPPPTSPLLPVHMPRYEPAPTPQNSDSAALFGYAVSR